jgi:TolB-like protein
MNQEPLSFLGELKRRNVVRVGVVYLIAAWLLAQVADLMLENFHAPDWVIQAILVVLMIGFPIALIFAWAFELTPEGLKREHEVDRSQSITPKTGRKLDFIIIGILAVALGYFIWESRFESTSDVIPASAGIQEPSNEALDGAEESTTKVDEASAKSIAVLPFVNMSSDPEQEYFSDGISEEILNSLAKVKELKVAGRTSSFAFKGENQDLRQVGETLGVEHILEGSVRKSGNKVRITAQLIQVDDGFHLWSESYDRELTDVFEIQDEIATAILEQLKAHLLDGEQVIVASTRADSQAFDLYLLAKQRIYERTGPTIESAVELLDRAIAIDPDYAPAYAQRGIAELLLSEGAGSYGDIPSDQALANGKLYIDKALQLDPNLAEGWAGMGLYYNNQPVVSEASIEPLRKALELNPNMLDAANWLLITYMNLGRPSDARDVVLGMIERDPLYRPGIRNAINSYNWFGQMDKAQAFLDRVQPLIPNDANIASSQAAIYMRLGQTAKALVAAEKAVKLQPSNSVARLTRGFALLETQQWERLLEEGEEWQPIYALMALDRTEEASVLAFERAEKLADVGTLINLLNLTNRSDEAVSYLEERWPDLDAFEKDFPPYGGLGHLVMLDVALAYSRTGNVERFDDAMKRIQRVNSRLISEGINHSVFYVGEAAHQALAGNLESSLDFLDRAVSQGITSRLPIVLDWPQLEPLQGDPRYEAIQARMINQVNEQRAELGLEPVSI